MTPAFPSGQVCGTLALAAFIWWVNFGLHWVNFWIGMGTAASVLALLSFWFAGVPMKRTEWTGRAVLIGLVSAVLLYAIFALGNTLSGWLFRFAPHQVSAIYDI
ncbi:MAG: CPBP family intramembrane glutamate endopeptidase, partial [Bilophila wadsworthia]